jgi:formamidopyrimidine-DNA glycosylase
MELSGSLEIVINPMLTGRFRISTNQRLPAKTDVFSIRTQKGVLWYSDKKSMSRVYIVALGDEGKVAGFEGRGLSALDPALTLEVFRTRVPRFQGQIKSVLQNQRFVKGIGNAYADEILLYAGILPFRRRSSLNSAEIDRLYNAMKSVLGRYREMLSHKNLEDLGPEKRDFLMIHNKGGGICPLCGGRISEVTANRFKTSYCQTCQK